MTSYISQSFPPRLSKFLTTLAFCAGLPFFSFQASAQLVQDDDRFLALRQAAMNEDAKKAALYASQLSQYPIPSYVEYYELKSRLRSASQEEILAYLKKYEGHAIADRLRNDWLLLLGQKGDWTNFDIQNPQYVVQDDAQVKCYALQSQALKQQRVATDARNHLISSKQMGEGCYSLTVLLYQQAQFNDADIWRMINLAAEGNLVNHAKRYGKLLDISENALTEALDKPAQYVRRAIGNDRQSKELFLLAILRLGRQDSERAAQVIESKGDSLQASDKTQAWANIGLPASLRLSTQAYNYWKKGEQASYLSHESHQWRTRIALREGDWKMVKQSIQNMPASLRNQSTWTYWLARALMQENKAESKQEAMQLYTSLSKQHDFYGQLALEEQGSKITAPAFTKPPTKEEIEHVSKVHGLHRAMKFYQMNLRFEGNREWNWSLRLMTERELLATAEFARQNDYLDRMVNTSDRTRSEYDFNQRFPTPFSDKMIKATQALGMDTAWVYGLVRQESRFVKVARSHVGASGLMQVMPATAKLVARKIGLVNFSISQLNDVDTNILLGTHYLSMVLNDLGGSQALASAAYNAGPGRPRAWRATLKRTVEGAIFAETIPFTETRDYVKNVLSNATYYAALIEKKPQSLKARLGKVEPQNASLSTNEWDEQGSNSSQTGQSSQ